MSEFIRLYAPQPATVDEVSEGFTPAQEAKRRRWAQVLCTSAQNETSLRMARNLCRSWFPQCQCDCRRGQDN